MTHFVSDSDHSPKTQADGDDKLGEFGRVERYFAPLTVGDFAPYTPSYVRGITFDSAGLRDDCATMDVPDGCELLVNTDTLVVGVHFIGDEDPQTLAQKLLAVNASDIICKGAYPVAYMLNLSIPKEFDDAWIAGFTDGLKKAQTEMGMVLLGGDSTLNPVCTLSATVFALIPTGGTRRRMDCKVDDDIWVIGNYIGDGYLGLKSVQGNVNLPPNHIPHVQCHYEAPNVMVELAGVVADYAHGALDVSDGLVADCIHLSEASQVAMEIWADKVPLSPSGQSWVQSGGDIRELLTGGDDYAILMSAPKINRDSIMKELVNLDGVGGIIGTVKEGAGVSVFTTDGGEEFEFQKTGYTHE